MRGMVRLGVSTLAALVLAGCGTASTRGSGAETKPTASSVGVPVRSADPAGLVGLWQVEQATGAEPGAVLRVADDITLWRRCGMLRGGWRASTEGSFVGLFYGGSPTCPDTSQAGPDWLRRAEGYRIEGSGPVLLDGRGAVVARLRPGGQPTVGPGVLRTEALPPVVTDQLRQALRTAVPVPAALRPATPTALVGRWVPAAGFGADTRRPPYLELLADGRWSGWDGCNGQGGQWTGGADGALLAVAGPQTLVACFGAAVGYWLSTASRAGFTTSELLVLLDRDGQEIARMQRARPGLTASPTATVPPPPIVLARARQIDGAGTGQQNRVQGPVGWVQTTLGAVWRAGGFRSKGKPSQPVYVVQVHGRFCCHPGPPGHDPTATTVFDILPVDGHLTDSLGGGASTGHPLDLTRLGNVHTFTLH